MADLSKLLEIFKRNPMQAPLDAARKASTMLSMHITGNKFKDLILQMDEFETEQKKNLRQKYSRSNKDIFSRLHRPIDKVFTAKGGSTIYNLPETSQKMFAGFMSVISNGMSLRKWVRNVLLPAYEIDPNGVILMERDANGNPIPTYQCTNYIFYYDRVGRQINTLILQLTYDQAKKYVTDMPQQAVMLTQVNNAEATRGKTRYYRVIDDVTDMIVEWDGTDLTEVIGATLPNYFATCPAMVVSDMVGYNSAIFDSPDSILVELATDYLTDCSTFNIWKKLHMFPKHWRVRSMCPTCVGTGMVSAQECPDCKGTTFAKRSSPRDELIIPLPDTADGKITIPSQFSGYQTPPIEAWELSTDELERLYELMYETLWGSPPKKVSQPGQSQTATAEVLDVQSMNERLFAFSEWCESCETFITNLAGQLMFGRGWGGCSIKYGDRYVIEPADAIWDKYSNARAKGAPQATLDNLLRDYYESRYEGSPIDLGKALKLMRIEPWCHMTIQQVQALTVTDEDKASKLYFSEWISLKNDMEIIMGTDEALRADLLTYTKAKVTIMQTEEAALIAAGQLGDGLGAPVARAEAIRGTS